MEEVYYGPNELITDEGSEDLAIYLIIDGNVEVFHQKALGRRNLDQKTTVV